MKKLIVFIFSIVLLGSCRKEEWNEDRDVDFSFNYNISWDSQDSLPELRWIIEYKIIEDPDTVSVTVLDYVFRGNGAGGAYVVGVNHGVGGAGRIHKLKNYDHLKFKVTTCAPSDASSWKHVKPINMELELEAYSSCDFENDVELMESLHTINSYDTTVYFNWSPPNFN